jgi:hypothetical protein
MHASVTNLLSQNAPDVLKRLSLNGAVTANQIFDELVSTQDQQITANDTVSQIPLVWKALAETVGLDVDLDGRIVGGPKALPAGLCGAVKTCAAHATGN